MGIKSEEYEVKETVLRALVAIMVFGGILTVLSNMAVIFFGLRRKRLFPAPILSLAFTDLLTGILATPLVIAIYYTKHTRHEDDQCSNQMKEFLKINSSINLYDFKWILPNILKASTAFHLVYITAMRLVDIAPRKVEEGNRNRSFGPILLVLVHVAAVVISCVNFFIETEVKEWCCKVFPFAEAWLTIIIPILLVIALNFIIFKETEDLKKSSALENPNEEEQCLRPGVDETEDGIRIERNNCSVGCMLSVNGEALASGT